MLFQNSLTASPLQQQYCLKSCHYRSLLKCDLINFVQLIFRTNSVNRLSKKELIALRLSILCLTRQLKRPLMKTKFFHKILKKFQEQKGLHAI